MREATRFWVAHLQTRGGPYWERIKVVIPVIHLVHNYSSCNYSLRDRYLPSITILIDTALSFMKIDIN